VRHERASGNPGRGMWGARGLTGGWSSQTERSSLAHRGDGSSASGRGVLKNLLELVAGLEDEAACATFRARLGWGVPGAVEEDTGRIGPDIQKPA